MKIRFIGDVHTKFDKYYPIVNAVEFPTIQVGDFGIGLESPGKEYDIDQINSEKDFFIRGNHDNPHFCPYHKTFIPDCSFRVFGNTKFGFFGGAKSIDQHHRKEGVDWWPDEENSYADWYYWCDEYEKEKPDVLVTHEVAQEMVGYLFPKAFHDKSITRQGLDSFYSIHRPKIHIFGHWHTSVDKTIKDTRFICLKELEYIDLEFK